MEDWKEGRLGGGKDGRMVLAVLESDHVKAQALALDFEPGGVA
jgi:hypothetical protein